MGRVTTGVYKGVHEDCEPPCNAAQASAVIFKTAISVRCTAVVAVFEAQNIIFSEIATRLDFDQL